MQFTTSQPMPSTSRSSYIVSPRASAGNRLTGTVQALAMFAALAGLIMFSPALAVAATAPTSDSSQDTWRTDAKPMKVGIIIYSTDAETVWNAFRFGGFALKKGDSVKVFLLAKGVDCEKLNTADFDVTGQMKSFVDSGGKILACGTCLTLRNSKGTELCPISTMKDMYDIVKGCDKVLTF